MVTAFKTRKMVWRGEKKVIPCFPEKHWEGEQHGETINTKTQQEDLQGRQHLSSWWEAAQNNHYEQS